MNSQKPTLEQLRRFAVSEEDGDFFRALVENPVLERYVAPFIGLHRAFDLMTIMGSYGNCAKIGTQHPEILTEEAFELLGVLIEWQKDPVLKQNLCEFRENLRDTLDSGLDRNWAWEQHSGIAPWTEEDAKNHLARRNFVVKFLSIATVEERTAFLRSFPESSTLVETFIELSEEKIRLRALLLEFLDSEGYGSKWQILGSHPELLAEETIASTKALRSELSRLPLFSEDTYYRPPVELLELCRDQGIEQGLFDDIGRIFT